MKRAFLTMTALAALTSAAYAQTSTSPPAGTMQNAPNTTQPSASGTMQDKAGQAGIRTVDPNAAVRVTFYTVQAADMRVSDLMGMDVYNLNNENIGEIEDLVIDDGKNIRAVVVSVGGFLGMGERNVAIDPRSIVVSTRNNATDRVVVNTTKDELKNAPEFKFTEKTNATNKANTGSNANTSKPKSQ